MKIKNKLEIFPRERRNGWLEVMEVDSAVNRRLPLVSLPYVFRLFSNVLILSELAYLHFAWS